MIEAALPRERGEIPGTMQSTISEDLLYLRGVGTAHFAVQTGSLVIEQEFFGVDECPQNIFVCGRHIVLVRFNIANRNLHFVGFSLP